ncbi:MAG: carboxypeptidase regulatory-like domain-containing protein [Janthinobacterium lividum]
MWGWQREPKPQKQDATRFRLAGTLWFCLLSTISASASRLRVEGVILDPTGRPLAGATIEIATPGSGSVTQGSSDVAGHFSLPVAGKGRYQITVREAGFASLSRGLVVGPGGGTQQLKLTLFPGYAESITVTADVNQVELFSPDPAETVFAKQGLIEANPGRPGAPVSIPGYPIETASSGIKAPQYFAPGVAGDHGEPIAQFIAVGGYLVPNNLSANAHGNGYADPNILVADVLSDVRVDGGAFNVLEGNHSVNLAATYGLRAGLDPFLTVTGDVRDVDLVAGIRPGATSWVALEASAGNGFLKRLEHRQQYKFNGQRSIDAGAHHLTLVGIGYYGFSYIPGLVPIGAANGHDANFPNVGDTIDPRQKDQTHTALIAANDAWKLSEQQQLQLSGFFRTYNLSLFSDFGQGLIRQSEFRTVTGATTTYANKFSDSFSLLAGLDFEREAPRRDDLDHYDFYTPGVLADGTFTKVDGSNVTITPITPYAAAQGSLGSHVRYYAGWRRDEIDFANQDLVQPENSFQQWIGVNSPKATVSVLPGPARWAPLVSGSFGESFFTEDPRIGTGSAQGTPVSRAHSYQLVTSKTISHTDLRLTLGHVTTAEELAKIDPDTGLQEDQGPGRLRFLTATVRQTFSSGSLLVTYSKADARDVDSGQPTAEAPRTIFDVLGVAERLPMKLQAKAEFEYVGAKPLGTGCAPDLNAQCVGVPVKEFRFAVVRPFQRGRMDVGVNLLAASGFSGQTLETFYPSPISEATGVRIPSYASVSFTYHLGRDATP